MPTTMLTTIEKGGFTNVKDLLVSVVDSMTANGMTRVFPATYDGTGTVILEPTVQVDPLYKAPVAGENPTSWRVAFTLSGETIQANVATAIQLQNDGTIAKASWKDEPVNPGELTMEGSKFVDRSKLSGIAGSVYPMSYILSVSDHGIFLGIWDQSTDEYQSELANVSPSFRWLVIQRPVLHTDGSVYVDGRAPVFCVYTTYQTGMIPRTSIEALPEWNSAVSLDSSSGVSAALNAAGKLKDYIAINGVYYKSVQSQFHRKFTVRESDVLRPSLSHPADQNVEDSAAILNANYQVSVSEDNRYVVTIPKGLNTTRYAYTHELDMIAYTSADVVGQWSEIELDVYGGQKYLYKSLLANRIKNTGMRILCRVTPAVAG